MALPILINGSECGPSNPLQNFTKVLDQDRGVTRDHFLSQHTDPSHGTFRSQQLISPSIKLESSRFFTSRNVQSEFASLTPASFDLAGLRGVLPTFQSHNSVMHTLQGQAPAEISKWATDFMQQQETQQQSLVLNASNANLIHEKRAETQSPPLSVQTPFSNLIPQWMPNMPSFRSSSSWAVAPSQGYLQSLDALQASLWDKEFVSHEISLQSVPIHSASEPVANDLEKLAKSEVDELARTAGLLVETVRDEQNPKFKKSDFMNLMRQLRDGELVVEGNEIVERSFDQNSSAETKGKGKQRQSPDFLNRPLQRARSWDAQNGPKLFESHSIRKSVHFDASHEQSSENQFTSEEDPNFEYFRQENDDYINYWTSRARQFQTDFETAGPEWGSLQDSWDSFEATASGIRGVAHYVFQPHNPYLLGETLRTQNHKLHTHNFLSLYESVLELEAAVQRDPLDVNAWFDLGVKQQESEREQKAISALQRAVDLDSSHLAAWLALAISHTNENHRAAADDAIEQWIVRNKKYESIVAEHHVSIQGEGSSIFQSQKHAALIECLMAMARSGEGEIDADVQIALAVLLNSSDEFKKSQDCFRTALAVRPHDWQLYNRVGATMANSGDAVGALHFYYRALELNPAYIRARFNLGISCINLKKYEEAAQHILDALVLQDSDGAVTGPEDKRGITSSALWEGLKTTCLHLQRIDLASLCDQQDLDGLRQEFHV